MYRFLTTLKPARSILTHAHIPSPHWSQKCRSQQCGGNYTKETDTSRQHSAARYSNGGKPEAAHNNNVTSRHYDRRAIVVSGDVRFQDGDAVNLSK